jgi:5S rRNA maturation endonuclease (ribonuclease M5)
MKELTEILKEVKFPTVVEGDSDKEALKKLGLEDIVPLNGKPLFKVASSLAKRTDRVLVLTDFDKEGNEIARKLNSWFTSFGTVPQSKLRGKIKKTVTRDGVSQIENLKPENYGVEEKSQSFEYF